MGMNLASYLPPCHGAMGQGAPARQGTERLSLAPWLELSPAVQLALALQFRILTSVHSFFTKRSPSGQVAEKSSFRTETLLKNSLTPGTQAGGVPKRFS